MAASKTIGSDSIRRATKCEHVRGRRVEPLRVIDDQQNWCVRGSLRDQVKRSHGNPEMLGRRLVGKAESGIERGALDVAEPARMVADGSQ